MGLTGLIVGVAHRALLDEAKRWVRRQLRKTLVKQQRQFYAYLSEAGYPPKGVGGHIVVEDNPQARDRFVKAILYAQTQAGLHGHPDGADHEEFEQWLQSRRSG